MLLAKALTERLNGMARPGLRATFELFASENHMSVLPVAVNRAVQSAFQCDA